MSRRKVRGISLGYHKARKAWRIRFEINKETWTESFTDKQLAEEAYKEYARRHLAGEDIRPEKSRTPAVVTGPKPGTVIAEGNTWLIENQRQRKAAGNDFYMTNMIHHVYPALGHLHVTREELNRDECLKFARSLVGKVSARTHKPLAYETRLGIINTLSAFCQWARDKHPKTFDSNPADRMVDVLVDADEAETVKLVWTHEEVERLLATTKERMPFWHPFLAFAIKIGARGGEQIELQWNLDFQVPGKVHIQRQYQTHKRRTLGLNEQGVLVAEDDPRASRIVPTKGRETRLVPLDEVEAILAEQRAMQRAWAFKTRQSQRDLVFTQPRGGRVNFRLFAQRQLPKLCEWAKVPSTTGFHSTRHTFATVLLYAGVPVADVSEWMGHADTATTERHYKHWIRDTRRDQTLRQMVKAAWAVNR